MVEAFRKQNMKVGFYHSLIDWHHDQFIIDPHIGPYRNLGKRDLKNPYNPSSGASEKGARRNIDQLERMNRTRNQAKYAEYLHNQTRELLTKFGKIDIMWFDFSYPRPDGTGKGRNAWQSEKLLQMVRQLQPHIIVNDRLDLPHAWDIKTPEQTQPREWLKVNGQKVAWEACQTFSGSWGYHRDESSWRSTENLIQTLIDCVSKGGNLILNVGPTSRGEFDDRALERLRGIGEWMRRHSRSIYGCTQAPEKLKTPVDCRLTYNPEKKRLYVHIFAWPYKFIHVDGLDPKKVAYAQLLNDGSEVGLGLDEWHAGQLAGDKKTLSIVLPQAKPNVTVPVVELFLK